MYDRPIINLAIASLRGGIIKFDKKLSENYIDNFPLYAVRRYVFAVAMIELKELIKIDNLLAFELYISALEIRYGGFVTENAPIEKKVKAAICIMIMTKIYESIKVAENG